MGYTDTKATKR